MRLRGRWIELAWGRLRVWEAGSGPPILTVHGLGGSGRYWQGLADSVGDRYRVIAPDLAGFGRSDKPAIDYSRAMHLDAIDTVIERLAPASPVVVTGHSLGGVLAALWAARRRDAVSGLALAATPFPSPSADARWANAPRLPPGVRVAGGIARVLVPILSVPVGLARGYPATVSRDFGRQTIRSRTRTMWSGLYDPTVTGDLEAVRRLPADVPVLLVNAADDRTVPLRAQDRWVRLLPGARREVVARGGHQFLLRTRFDALSAWVLALPSSPPSRT